MVAASTSTAAAIAGAAVEPPRPSPVAAVPPFRIRGYNHSTDHSEVLRICKTVYGGTDYMPRVIEERAAREDTLILSAEAVAGAGDAHDYGSSDQREGRLGPRLHGIVCAQWRGDGTAFLSGLRVCEDARGFGIGRRLMEAVSARAAAAPDITALVSTTGPHQAHSVRIFSRLGWAMVGCVEVWPPFEAMRAYEAKVGWPESEADARAHGSVIDMVPGGASDMLAHAAAAAAGNGAAWERCRDGEQLAAAVAAVRARQRAWWAAHRRRRSGDAAGRRGGDGSPDDAEAAAVSSPLPDQPWLPWVYDVLGVRSEECAEMLSDPRASFWLLRGPAASDGGVNGAADGAGRGGQTGDCEAVVVVAPSKLFRRTSAGVLAASPAAVAPALARAAAVAGPHFSGFVDRGARFWGLPAEGDDRAAWPELYLKTAAPGSSYYVYTKPAADAQVLSHM